MLQVAGRWRVAVALAVTVLISGQAAAQQPRGGLDELQAPLDPSAPLQPLPEIGIDWPDMREEGKAPIAQTPDTSIAEAAGEQHYDVVIEGLDAIGSTDLSGQFRQLSTLEEGRNRPANSAQIDRRAHEDSALLAELLRSHGYYDALVEPDIAAAEAGGRVRVPLRAEPGTRDHFSRR